MFAFFSKYQANQERKNIYWSRLKINKSSTISTWLVSIRLQQNRRNPKAFQISSMGLPSAFIFL